NDASTLGADTTLSGADVAFTSTLNSSGSSRSLLVNSGGVTAFGGAVGTTLAPASLTPDSARSPRVSARTIATRGGQTHNDPAFVGANTTLNANDVTFATTLDSLSAARSLTVNSGGGGKTTFTGKVGAGDPLSALTTNSDGTTEIDGGVVTTTGAQAFND